MRNFFCDLQLVWIQILRFINIYFSCCTSQAWHISRAQEFWGILRTKIFFFPQKLSKNSVLVQVKNTLLPHGPSIKCKIKISSYFNYSELFGFYEKSAKPRGILKRWAGKKFWFFWSFFLWKSDQSTYKLIKRIKSSRKMARIFNF